MYTLHTMSIAIPKFSITNLWTEEVACKYKNRYGYDMGCRCVDCKAAKSISTFNERKFLIDIYKEIKQNSCCDDCGWNLNPEILQFHHLVIDPSNRPPTKGKSIISFIRELKKGVFLCAICHTLRHYDVVNDCVVSTKIFKNSLYVEGSKGTRIVKGLIEGS